MSKSIFEAYGELARGGHDPVIMAGRYRSQAEAERLIVPELLRKLMIEPGNDLLEIGCGAGNLIIPLSFLVKSATGMDHPDVITKAAQRCTMAGLNWLPGPFPQQKPNKKFDRVLSYSVLHYLAGTTEILEFVTAAAELVAPGGRLMLGDIPNRDRKARFQASEFGAGFHAEWLKSAANSEIDANDARGFDVFAGSTSIGTLDDELILNIVEKLRKSGFNAYVVEQNAALPFGHTREDIVAVRP